MGARAAARRVALQQELPWDARLAALGNRARRRGKRLSAWLPFHGVVTFCLLLGIAGLFVYLTLTIVGLRTAAGPVEADASLKLLLSVAVTLLCLELLYILPRTVWVIYAGASLFRRQYLEDSRILQHTDLARLLTDEEQWEIILRNLGRLQATYLRRVTTKRRLEEQLQQAAAFRLAYGDLQHGLQHLRWYSLRRGQLNLGVLQLFRLAWWLLGGVLLVIGLPMVTVMLFGVYGTLFWLAPLPVLMLLATGRCWQRCTARPSSATVPCSPRCATTWRATIRWLTCGSSARRRSGSTLGRSAWPPGRRHISSAHAARRSSYCAGGVNSGSVTCEARAAPMCSVLCCTMPWPSYSVAPVPGLTSKRG
jgi:hypothetical protein